MTTAVSKGQTTSPGRSRKQATCIAKQSPSPLNHTFLLGRARFTAQPLSALVISRRCTTTTWKCLISRFVEHGNTRQQLSFSFLELWYSLLELNSKKISNIWQIKGDGISAIKFEAARIHFLSDVFVAERSCRCFLNSLLAMAWWQRFLLPTCPRAWEPSRWSKQRRVCLSCGRLSELWQATSAQRKVSLHCSLLSNQ